MRTIFGLLLAIVLGWVFWRVWVIAEKSGMLRTLTYTANAECRAVAGAIGAEDIADARGPLVPSIYVSAFDRRKWLGKDKSTRGMIAAFSSPICVDFTNREGKFDGKCSDWSEKVEELTGPDSGAPERFAPHGLSILLVDGKGTLGVINHADGEAVELFDMQVPDKSGTVHPLIHRRTIKDPSFRSLNDLVLVGPDAFYATNDHHYPPGFMQTVENYLLLDKTDVTYFDGTAARVAAEGLTYANGINVSPDGKRIYVAETTDNVLRTYDRNIETGDLTLVPAKWGKTDLGFGLDNIDVAPDGSLTIAGHPKLLTLQKHFAHPEVSSPTEVVRLVPTQAGWDVKQVFLDDGKRISGGSVAVRVGDSLVLGSILSKDVLVCPYKE